MKKIFALVLLVPALAFAGPPDDLSDADALLWQLAQAKLETAKAYVQTAEANLQTVQTQLGIKYSLGATDKVDLGTRHISRAPKKGAEAPKK